MKRLKTGLMASIILLLLTIISVCSVCPREARAQEPVDSTTVATQALRNLRTQFLGLQSDTTRLRAITRVQDSLISKQRQKIRLDSVRIRILKQRFEGAEERIEIQKERVKALEAQNRWRRIRGHLWVIVSGAAGILVGKQL